MVCPPAPNKGFVIVLSNVCDEELQCFGIIPAHEQSKCQNIKEKLSYLYYKFNLLKF